MKLFLVLAVLFFAGHVAALSSAREKRLAKALSGEFGEAFDRFLVELSTRDTGNASDLRQDVKDAFWHAYSAYVDNAWPHDELKPLSCEPRIWNERSRGTLDDCLGGFALTMVDTLDTLAIMGEKTEFRRAVEDVIANVHFDRDVVVSVFETTIRVLGGLLSSHTLIPKIFPGEEETAWYHGELLSLAIDLGDRLIPAFNTRTGIPFHRINLEYGILSTESHETCPAAAGTLLIEFGMLSKLSGDSKYEQAAKAAVLALWERRSSLDLIGNTINVTTGRWLQKHASTGPGADSFYEYLLKCYVLFGDEDLMEIFQSAYIAVKEKLKFGPFHLDTDMNKGVHLHYHVSSLQAFWPGMQVMVGDIREAKETHLAFLQLWHKFGILPEGYDLAKERVIHFAKYYPLRPELAESTYMLYEATHDPFYLSVGKYLFESIVNLTKVECGFASIADVKRHTLDDRMDSFFLSETLKYLFLLFDKACSASAVPFPMEDAVFSTEGHPFFVSDPSLELIAPSKSFDPVCPVWDGGNGVPTVRIPHIRASSSQCQMPSEDAQVAHGQPKLTIDVNLLYRIRASFVSETLVLENGNSGDSNPMQFHAVGALFGLDWSKADASRFLIVEAQPADACSDLSNCHVIRAFIRTVSRKASSPPTGVAVLAGRGKCMFDDKARFVERCGAKYLFVTDSAESGTPFAMARSSDERKAPVKLRAAMISKRIGDRIRQSIKNDERSLRSLHNPESFHPMVKIEPAEKAFEVDGMDSANLASLIKTYFGEIFGKIGD